MSQCHQISWIYPQDRCLLYHRLLEIYRYKTTRVLVLKTCFIESIIRLKEVAIKIYTTILHKIKPKYRAYSFCVEMFISTEGWCCLCGMLVCPATVKMSSKTSTHTMQQSNPPRGGSASARKYKIDFYYWPGDVNFESPFKQSLTRNRAH